MQSVFQQCATAFPSNNSFAAAACDTAGAFDMKVST
jgi:hypothetical protein